MLRMFHHSNFTQRVEKTATALEDISLPARNATPILTADVGKRSLITVSAYRFEGVRVPVIDTSEWTFEVGVATTDGAPSMREVEFPARFLYTLDDVAGAFQAAVNAEAAEFAVPAPVVSFIYESATSARLAVSFVSGFTDGHELFVNADVRYAFVLLPTKASGALVPSGGVCAQRLSSLERINPAKRFLIRSSGLPVLGEYDAYSPTVGNTDKSTPFLADYQFPPIAFGEPEITYNSGKDGAPRYHDLTGEVIEYDLLAFIELRSGEKLRAQLLPRGYAFVDITYELDPRTVSLQGSPSASN